MAMTGWIPDVVAGGPVASSWASSIADRMIMTFNAPEEREAAVPSPQFGMLAYIYSTDTLEFFSGLNSWVPLTTETT